MSQAGGLRGGSQVPKVMENLWGKGKYAALGVLFMATLPLFIPVFLFLMVLAIPLSIPVGCGIVAYLIVKNRCNIPSVTLSDWVDRYNISPSRSEGSSTSVSRIQSLPEMFVKPASEPSSPSTPSTQHEPSTTSAPSRQHVQESEGFESPSEEGEVEQRLSGKNARGGSYMIKIPKTDPGSRGLNESSPVSTITISESPAKGLSSPLTGSLGSVDKKTIRLTTPPNSPQSEPEAGETTKPQAGESQSENNIQQPLGDSSLSTPGKGSGQERKEAEGESSGGNVEGTPSSPGPSTSSPEGVQQVPTDSQPHEHVQYVKDDSSKLGKRGRRRKGRQAQAQAQDQ